MSILNKFEQLAEQGKTFGKAKEKIDNTQLLNDSGLRIRHIRKNGPGFPDSCSTRDLTVAYREGNSVIEISTAVVHPNDKFNKKMGTKLAIESFNAGKVVRIPKTVDYQGNSLRPATALRTINLMFGW